MGRPETSIIDEQPTARSGQRPPAVGTTPRAAGGSRLRRALVLAAAVAVAGTGVVVWSAVGGDAAVADRGSAHTAPSSGAATTSAPAAAVGADPTASATSATSASAAPSALSTPSAATAGAPGAAGTSAAQPTAAALPAGWEPRTFQGVTFAVPPGATAADVQDPGNADAPASFVWTGPSLGSDTNAQITVWIYPADKAPAFGTGYQPITVPGAERAQRRTGATGSQPPMTAADVQIQAGARFINVVGMFAAGPAGEQMVRDLIAAVSIG